MQIRPFIEADIEKLHVLITHTIEVSYHEAYPKEAIEFFKEIHTKDNVLHDCVKGFCVVAEEAGQLLGTGTLLGTHILRVFVHPTAHQRGLGRRIMERLEQQGKEQGLRYIELHSSIVAKVFYQKIGYIILEELFIPVANQQKLDLIKMVKPISLCSPLKWSLEGLRFEVVMNVGQEPAVNQKTIYHFKQQDCIVTAKYDGGEIQGGRLVGMLEGDILWLSYEQTNLKGEYHTGQARGELQRHKEGYIHMDIAWRWETKQGTGHCVLRS